ncbi:Dabb family protein [Desulfocurvibacter africanus]|uniref:Dabb family protein n=1 Tax=Desulfocurvibacter africanus TaxID=873 RepID=UPI0003FEDF87|nr:Dabb family protein [Desulfocurvibacter africanus]
MVKHIVMWMLKDETQYGTKAEAALRMKQMLEDLQGKIPTLRKIEVATEIFAASPACDVALYSEFDSRADLDAYQVHPEHQACVAFIKQIVTERRVLDYEI